jgi:hypothetical protein
MAISETDWSRKVRWLVKHGIPQAQAEEIATEIGDSQNMNLLEDALVNFEVSRRPPDFQKKKDFLMLQRYSPERASELAAGDERPFDKAWEKIARNWAIADGLKPPLSAWEGLPNYLRYCLIGVIIILLIAAVAWLDAKFSKPKEPSTQEKIDLILWKIERIESRLNL